MCAMSADLAFAGLLEKKNGSETKVPNISVYCSLTLISLGYFAGIVGECQMRVTWVDDRVDFTIARQPLCEASEKKTGAVEAGQEHYR